MPLSLILTEVVEFVPDGNRHFVHLFTLVLIVEGSGLPIIKSASARQNVTNNILFGVSELVSWCFKPSQPQRIISGLRETCIKRFIVERTNKAELRPKEQNEKAESCREKLWNEIQLIGP